MSPAVADMEEVKSSQLDDGAAMEIRFSDLCNKLELDLDESSMAQAIVLFKETKHILLANMSAIGTGSPEEIERLWSAFVLFFVAGLNQGAAKQEEEGGVILSRILRAFKLNASDFFKELPQFSLKTGPVLNRLYGADWERRLGVKELKANIDQLVLLTGYYKRTYREFFLPCDMSTGQCSAVSNSAEYVSDYYRFGWLLFLALRKHAFSPFKDLVTCAKGLVSILVISILHIPMQFRNFNIQNSPLFAKKSDQGINLLASLSGIYETTEDELRRTTEQVNNLIVEILKRKPCPASNCKSKNLDYINPDGLTYFEDLLEENSLQASLLQLEKEFGNGISIESDLDERILVNDGNCFLGAESLSGGVITISGTKRKFDLFAPSSKAITSPLSPQSSPATPRNGNLVSNSKMPASTPVSTAMTTAKWLRDVISPLPSKPSAELERFLSSCDRDVTSNVTRRANIILEAIFPTNYFGERCVSGNRVMMGLMDSTWAEQRKMEALKLYYRVLEAICRAESHILNGNNLTSLLSNEQFHRCMLACSAELVLATYKTIIMTFPAVLEKAGITAFDLSKVIESFVRHEETLPRELKRYLNSLEERLLESLVWEKGSSMYNFLIVARPALSAEINRLGLLAEPLPSLDAIAMHHNIYSGGLPPLSFQKHEHSPGQNGDPRSPKRRCGEYRSVLVERNSFASPIKERLLTFNSPKSKTPPLQSAFASPTRPNLAGGETCAEAGINIFLSKITKLAAIRIRSLCERLGLSQQIQEHIYYLIQKVLSQRTALFFERHIDQIILCSFYGVAKISQLNLTFKEIIHNYRKQPQCKPLVFRSILVNWPSTSHNGKIGQEHVDIITFYNGIFIPSVKPLLMELDPSEGSQKKTRSPEDKNNSGQIPGSPQLSSFPNLPDMSPKKVSASHNVFVSPLQPSKMDSLLSPSSKSYYACIGESTHAFQSPSKDLTAINDHLNCGRKINGRLNFDVVSDSVVVRSLYNQNGSSASSTATFNLPPPVKLDQPNP